MVPLLSVDHTRNINNLLPAILSDIIIHSFVCFGYCFDNWNKLTIIIIQSQYYDTSLDLFPNVRLIVEWYYCGCGVGIGICILYVLSCFDSGAVLLLCSCIRTVR